MSVDSTPNPVPAYNHIIVVIGENKNAGSVFEKKRAPYINSLAASGARFSNAFALFHPSQPNYLALFSGSNQGITGDEYITTKFNTPNLGSGLIKSGRTYITYSEGLPSLGYDGNSNGLYGRKHNPSANWVGSGNNQLPATTNKPFSDFPSDFNNLPSVCFVIPDACNDGHDGCYPLYNNVLQYDQWIKNHLASYAQWCVNNNSLLIITFDEDEFTAINKIATVFYGAHIVPGTYTENINHYTVLRTIEDAFRIATHAGSAAFALPVDNCWTNSMLSNTISEPAMRVYPNPAKNMINIEINDLGLHGYIRWEIDGLMGAVLRRGDINGRVAKTSINILELKNGVYVLRISDGTTIRLNKFVVTR